MSPRNYKMEKRAAAVEETRKRIVQATLELHAEQGIAATSWDQIAARAGLGVGTVYRHFRDFDELLPACGELTWTKLDVPKPSIFDGVAPGKPRLELLVRSLFAVYERGHAELRNIRSEAALHPVIANAHREVEADFDALVAAAVDERHALVRALTDLGTWQALVAHAVTDPAAAIVDLLQSRDKT